MLDSTELFEAVGGSQDDPDGNVIDRLRFDDALEIPIELTDLDLWKNYVNDDLYVLDKKVREFFSKTRYRREKNGGYNTTVSMVFMWMFGRKPTSHDSHVCHILHVLMRYYCTSFTGKTTFQGKPVNRVYKFSKYATVKKRPYSLRLRLEEANDGRDGRNSQA